MGLVDLDFVGRVESSKHATEIEPVANKSASVSVQVKFVKRFK